jgi:SP family sugar:H+ symporter-like MFS transporter
VLGRRGVMRVAAVLFILSAIGAGAASSSALFVIARFIGGAGVGAASVLSPAYISEVTPAGIRGRLSSVQQIMIITGITGAFLANYALAHWAGSSLSPFWLGLPTWRWMFWAQVIPSAIYFVALMFIPESPRFLVVKGREAEAERVLVRLFGAGEAKRKVGGDPRVACERPSPEARRSHGSGHGPRAQDRLDRHRARGVPAARRHQHSSTTTARCCGSR